MNNQDQKELTPEENKTFWKIFIRLVDYIVLLVAIRMAAVSFGFASHGVGWVLAPIGVVGVMVILVLFAVWWFSKIQEFLKRKGGK